MDTICLLDVVAVFLFCFPLISHGRKKKCETDGNLVRIVQIIIMYVAEYGKYQPMLMSTATGFSCSNCSKERDPRKACTWTTSTSIVSSKRLFQDRHLQVIDLLLNSKEERELEDNGNISTCLAMILRIEVISSAAS